ncbi:uncharacterized protein LOC108048480 [Drosophila rhopaloa]|uniref:Uncharacterized protein LOC108048480 n=1 Tax=Drosophila rhopaloa TaxID=1041015 RepID=A0A6P4FBJ8_DRORH|nr:uncharacterized protein LOC108048480 [Drosophila rhopaloa]
MDNIIKSSALLEILKSPLPDFCFESKNEDGAGNLGRQSAVKLSAEAPEFVPRFKREESTENKDEDVDLNELKKMFEALDDEKATKPIMLKLPWKGFPKRSQRTSHSTQVVLLNEVDYMIVPRNKGTKKSKEENLFINSDTTRPESKGNATQKSAVTTSSDVPLDSPPPAEKRLSAQERRREQERNVALEALKLAEQRRRGHSVPSPDCDQAHPIVHLSRSPLRFTPEERIKVDRLKAAKRERIEKALLEMANNQQEQQDNGSPNEERTQNHGSNRHINIRKEPQMPGEMDIAQTKRYIPTAKEWNVQRRAKHMAKMEAKVENENCFQPAKTRRIFTNSRGNNIKPSKFAKGGDLVAKATPPTELLKWEQRKGNLTHFRKLPKSTPRQMLQTPFKMPINLKEGDVQRYSIEQLLELEPQPEELEKPNIDQILNRLGLVSH